MDKQKDLLLYQDRCYFGSAPTLAEIKTAYGEGMVNKWLSAHIFDLSEFCGCRQKIPESSLIQCTQLITTAYYYLKASEIMLFLQKFKLGNYGRFYGSVDPLIIMTALKEFLEERSIAISRHEAELNEQREREWKKNAITHEEYERSKAAEKQL